MACSTKTLKVFALLWDFLYTILSLAVVGIGIYILFKFDFDTAAYVIIGLGVIVTLCSVFGILGAVRESSRLSKCFVAFVIVLAILHVLIVGFFWIFQTSLLINVDKTFDKLWNNQVVPIRPGNNTAHIASLERWLECCGNAGSSDYVLAPHSCYNSETDKLNMDGCRQKFLDYIADRWTIFNIFALVLVVVELICAAFAYVLANSIVNRWRRSKYYTK
ncbi:hypothetical protein FF38_02367 [Lucilia cuprina]|uniref:Tetraspanin n=1 Tax=Lucilia cuprina TaxID=7375 RepID=A0A0L0CCQ4_LUCCU|nr:protein late bloomer [Lucilia cuprina]XP_046810578.1 protein late bloomer [Lucilia cuprina]KNC29239.1 hypothetical protein FF38_02367 [Lucilia cuprina]